MKKFNKKTLAYIFMVIGIMLLIFGIVMSVSLGAKDIDFLTIIKSLATDNNDVNTKIH